MEACAARARSAVRARPDGRNKDPKPPSKLTLSTTKAILLAAQNQRAATKPSSARVKSDLRRLAPGDDGDEVEALATCSRDLACFRSPAPHLYPSPARSLARWKLVDSALAADFFLLI